MDHTKSLSEYFDTKYAKFAQMSLDYLDGKQLEYVVKLLDDPNYGRRKWKERGMRPMSRNITGMIVEKSAQVFVKHSPTQEVYNSNDDTEPNDDLSQAYANILEDADFDEFMQNFDQVVRLLKTGIILTQYNEKDNSIMLDCLHRGNAVVWIDPMTKEPTKLLYKVFEDEYAEYCYYRIFTADKIEDWREKEQQAGQPPEEPELISSEDNPYGIIPMATFYDTNAPRVGYWNVMPTELVNFNESYNLNLVDLAFGAAWNIHKTLFTNCEITAEGGGTYEVREQYGQALPRQVASSGGDGAMMGLARVVQLDTTAVESPFVEFKGPDSDLTGSSNLFSEWARDYAADWSVRVKASGEGVASSGFQLIVEEFDNLELRGSRSKMFAAGLAELYDVVKVIWNTHQSFTEFPEDSVCVVTFPQPSMPVEKKEEEEVWTSRLNQKRATPIDYFMEVLGLTEEEANAKWEVVQEFYAGTEVEPSVVVGSPQVPEDAEEEEATDEEM